MPILELQTVVHAPVERVFDLCRSVDAHFATTGPTAERAIGGVTAGLLELGDEVTWSARHLGLRWSLTARITRFDRPRHFRDSQVAGPFGRFDHDHDFEAHAHGTLVRDRFDYTSPLGPLGRLADALLVERHMRLFLTRRMQALKQLAEGDAWAHLLANPSR